MNPNFKKRIDPILRDIKPLSQRKETEIREKRPAKQKRKVLTPRSIKKIIFIVFLVIGLIFIIPTISLSLLLGTQWGDNISGVSSPFGQVKELVGVFQGINSDLGKLKERGFDFIFKNQGEELIATLKSLRANLEKLKALNKSSSEEQNLATISEGLDALISFLDKSGKQHLLLLFLNPSEIRPIGGFAGSYGEITLERGSIKDIKVNDIYYPDRFLNKKVVPPIQLQTITVDWEARDAGWFFDFPTSANKIAEFIESSEIYSQEAIKFDGVIALNVRVIEDILGIAGPIKVPEYNLVLTRENFLEEIQREVEVGRDNQPGENPKKILSALTPILIERLVTLDESSKNTLALSLLARAINKDIQFYFDDPKVEEFVKKIGWAGEVANLASNFNGDYLAVVNTNVAGGKTDAKIKQSIKLKSRVDSTGRINNHLTVTRSHLGASEQASWYRTKNQNFIKVFTVPGAELDLLEGATPKIIKPRINYSTAGYLIDPVLAAVERTEEKIDEFNALAYSESGKGVFAAWFSLLPDETKTLKLIYKGHQTPLISGTKYQFIFDKQSGAESDFEYELIAPSGFHWLESSSPLFTYESDTTPARLVLDLTLVRNE